MSTLAQALTIAGSRQSGAPVRTQNGKFLTLMNHKLDFRNFHAHHMFMELYENDLNWLSMSVRSIENSCFRQNDNNYYVKETKNRVKLLKSAETYKCGCLMQNV